MNTPSLVAVVDGFTLMRSAKTIPPTGQSACVRTLVVPERKGTKLQELGATQVDRSACLENL